MLQAQVPGGSPGVELLAQGAADLALLDRPGLRGRLQRMLDHAYEQGTIGVADDLLSYLPEDWGFDLDEVRAPVQLVYGAKDPVVPSAHGRWYRRHLRDAHLTVVPRAGHLAIAPAWERILQHVDPQHGRRSDA
jgi:pimeloyl-ACP methyl ester carboxylesterase